MQAEHVGLFTLLQEMDAICRKHGIVYYLEGGSLLGAVRHKGFLPWDDDVDLCITRDNFKKLLKALETDLPQGRELFCYERFPDYARDTVKYTNMNTSVVYRNHVLDGYACGQHIDLFILDPVPADPEKLKRHHKLSVIYSELMMPVYVMSDEIVDCLPEYQQYVEQVRERGLAPVLEELRQELFTYDDTDDCVQYSLRWGNRHILYEKAFFGEPVELEFEGQRFYGPSQYHRFLRSQFGDTWMMVPEEQHQETHDSYSNLHIPSDVFRQDYVPFLDLGKMRQECLKRKKHSVKAKKKLMKVKQEQAQMQKIFYELELEQMLRQMPEEVESWLREEQYAKVAAYYEPYVQAQLSALLKTHRVALDVTEPVLHAAALSLTMVGRFGEGEKLIMLTPDVPSERIGALLTFISDIRACVLAQEESRMADAAAIAGKWLPLYPLQHDLALFDLRHSTASVAQRLTRTAAFLERYPGSDQLMLLMGDLHQQAGHAAEAEDWYRRTLECTHNGLIRLALGQKS